MSKKNTTNVKCSFEDALDMSGFGMYNYAMLSVCCLLILAMYIDIFGFSVLLPSVACDMNLTVSQQGLLSAIPLIGIMISSYAWGLCADTLGRRKTLLLAMPIGALFNLATSIAPNFITLCVLKFLSAGFSSSANAAAFVLLGESVPRQNRSRFMFLMASATMIGQLAICTGVKDALCSAYGCMGITILPISPVKQLCCVPEARTVPALPIFNLQFHIDVPFLGLEYRPWRLLMQVLSLPAVIGIIGMILLQESPKFLLSKGLEYKTVDILKIMFNSNTKLEKHAYPVTSIFLETSDIKKSTDGSFLQQMWNQTAPLFRPPLLKNSLKLYFILLCAYMTSTGFTMWVPTMTNAYFNGEDTTGMTYCEVASTATKHTDATNSTFIARNCDDVVRPMALYAVMVYSGLCGFLNLLLTFIVGPLGKKKTTLLVFMVTVSCGIVLLFVKTPMYSLLLSFVFPYVALILGNINTYLVELNPTYLRGMATCLSVVVARGFGFISVQLIATFLSDHCMPMLLAYIGLVLMGFVTAFFLPPDTKKPKEEPSKIDEIVD